MKVLRILEGDMIMDGNYASTPGSEAGNRSGWLSDRFSERLSVETPRLGLWERERGQGLELSDNKQ